MSEVIQHDSVTKDSKKLAANLLYSIQQLHADLLKWEVPYYPPYSPNLSPCDYDFNTKIKEPLEFVIQEYQIL
ncbi:hypothetical protein Trydic_g7623 [Trypoxylus dichotomus]